MLRRKIVASYCNGPNTEPLCSSRGLGVFVDSFLCCLINWYPGKRVATFYLDETVELAYPKIVVEIRAGFLVIGHLGVVHWQVSGIGDLIQSEAPWDYSSYTG